MVRALAVSIILAIVVLFTTFGNAQPITNQFGEVSEAISWEMYRQRQVEMQLEIQRQQYQLELEKQRIERQKKQIE